MKILIEQLMHIMNDDTISRKDIIEIHKGEVECHTCIHTDEGISIKHYSVSFTRQQAEEILAVLKPAMELNIMRPLTLGGIKIVESIMERTANRTNTTEEVFMMAFGLTPSEYIKLHGPDCLISDSSKVRNEINVTTTTTTTTTTTKETK